MREIKFKCTYEDFFNVSGRRDSSCNQKLWLDVVATVNTEHHELIKAELCEAIALLANDDI
jgi:hypothetical protein